MKIIPKQSKSFDITFDIVYSNFESGWKNIFHFTKFDDGTDHTHGSRTPSLIMNKDRPRICFLAITTTFRDKYRAVNLPAVSLNTKYRYRFRQYQDCPDCIYKFQIIIDGDVFRTYDNEFPIQNDNVRVYFSNPMHSEAPVIVSNFVYTQY